MTLQTYMLFSTNAVKHILILHQQNVNLTMMVKLIS